MNVAIDTSTLETADRVRGTGLYTRLLIDALQKYGKQHSYSFFTRGQKVPKDADVVHYPYFTPFFLTLPLFIHCPFVVTVHDLIPIEYPDKFPRGIRGSVKWPIQRNILRRARRIITDSRASQKAIFRFAGVPAGKIAVVPLAPADAFRPLPDAHSDVSVLRRYGIKKPYILYVGDVNWNKNVDGLVGAFASLREQEKDRDITLCLVGESFTNEQLAEVQRIDGLIRSQNLRLYVKKVGFVKETDLRVLYAGARAYVQPSFAEGFGLPVLEAMACGCPVVCSTATALSEIAGPAVRVDPEDPASIAVGIRRVVAMAPGDRSRVVKKGLEWVKKFTWENVAHETLAVYESAR